jgi:trigger factor
MASEFDTGTDVDTAPEGSEPTASLAQKLELQVAIESPGPCERHVVVTIPRSEVDRYLKKTYDDLRPRAELPGFRPGKAPRKLVESRFKEQVSDQVKSSLVMDSLQQVTEGQGFSPISEPELNFEAVDLPDSGDFTYEFDIEVRPDFDTPEWKGLQLSRPIAEVTEAAIDSGVRNYLSRYSSGESVEGPVQANDRLLCTLQFSKDGKVLSEHEEVQIDVRPKVSFVDAIIEDFDQWIQGASEGEKLTREVLLSEGASDESLRGQNVQLELEILEIKRLDPALDQRAMQMLGTDPESLRDYVTSDLKRQLAYEQQQQLRRQITDQLISAADLELPPKLVKRQVQRELQRRALELRRYGLPEGQVQSYLNTLRREAEQMTIRSLREHFVLERIAEQLELEPESSEYDDEIELIASQQGSSARRVRAQLEKSGQMDALRNQIVERRVLETIQQSATITDTPDDKIFDSMPSDCAVDVEICPPVTDIPEAKYDESPTDGIREGATIKPTP